MLLGLLTGGLALAAGPGQLTPFALVSAPVASAPGQAARELVWIDLDGDGALDALTVDGSGRLTVFRNAGDGSFVDRTADFGLAQQVIALPGRSSPLLVSDVDQDGDEDLLVAREDGPALFLRAGRAFVDATETSGLAGLGPVDGLAWVELDGLPAPDLHVITPAGHRLFAGGPGGSFRELALPFAGRDGTAPAGVDDAARGLRRTAERTAERSGGAPGAEPAPGGPGGPGKGLAGPTITPSAGPPVQDIFECVDSMSDLAGGACIEAARMPMLGVLYPIGVELFIEAGTGNVGVGTLAPAARLDVAGDLRVSDVIVSTKATGAPLQVASSDLVTGLNADLIDGLEASAFSQLGVAIETAELEDGAVTTAKLADAAVTNTKLSPDAVDTSNLLDASVTAAKLAPGAVSSAALAPDSVGPIELQPAAVTTVELADASVSSTKLQNGSVTSSALAASSVTAAAIAPFSVGTSALVPDSVDGSRLAAGAVGTAHLVAEAVTSGELATDAVGSDELQDGAVTSSHLAASAVDTTALADGAVTSVKLGAAAVLTANLAPAVVTATELAAAAVGTAALQLDAVDGTILADDAVSTSELQDAAVTLAKLDPSEGSAGLLLAHDGTGVAWKADDGVPAGTMLLLDDPTAPAGYTATGQTLVVQAAISETTLLAPLSAPRAEHGAATLDGLIYAVGGMTSVGIEVASVEAYDPLLDTWTPRAPLGTARRGLAVVAAGGRLYAVGGSVSGTAMTTVEEYDPVMDLWTPRAALGLARAYLGCAAVGGKVYAIGGIDGITEYAAVEEYDPMLDAWTPRAPMPTGRGYHGMAAASGRIYALGGFSAANQIVRTVEEYDPVADSWRTVLPLLGPSRWRLTAADIDGRVYALGGIDDTGITRDDVVRLSPPAIWVQALPVSTPRFNHASTSLDGVIYTTGGRLSSGVVVDTVEALEAGTDELHVMRKD